MPAPAILIALLFQAVWIVTALGAARGLAWPGVAAGVLLIGLHLAAAHERGRALVVVGLCGALGAIGESLLAALGFVGYAAGWPGQPWIAPAWLIALWAAFAATLPAMRKLLGGLPWLLVALIGGAVGVLSYLAGERLGALTFLEPRLFAFAAVAALWAVALPLLLALESRLAPMVAD
jgi:hypothetical protein